MFPTEFPNPSREPLPGLNHQKTEGGQEGTPSLETSKGVRFPSLKLTSLEMMLWPINRLTDLTTFSRVKDKPHSFGPALAN